MKTQGQCHRIKAAVVLMAMLGTSMLVLPSRAVVLPEDVLHQLQQRFDAFVNAEGYSSVDLSAFPDNDWYSAVRFPQMSSDPASVLRPDHDLDPVTRMMLFVNSREKELPHVRYRITYRLAAAPGDYADVRHAYVEIARFNLGPAMYRQTKKTANGHVPVAPRAVFGVGPHVSWRFVTNTVQGMNASIVRASRREISNAAAQVNDCLGQSCLSLRDPMGPVQGDWRELQPPQLASPVYSDSDGFMPGPARSAQYLYAQATRHGEEPAYGNFADKPQMVLVISKDIDGQDRTLNGLLQQPHLMDDAISAIWTRRLQATPDAIEWRTLAVPRPGRSQPPAPQSQAPQPTEAAPGGLAVPPTASRPSQDTIGKPPRFEDYPAAVDTGVSAVMPRRALRRNKALQEDAADFSGSYVVYGWGCGTGCGMTGFVDRQTGDDLEQTFTGIRRSMPLQGFYDVRGNDGEVSDRLQIGNYAHFLVKGEVVRAHRADSRLLVTTQAESADFGTFAFRYFHNYYVLEQNELRRIRQVGVAQPYRDHAAVDFGPGAHGLLVARKDDVPLFDDYPETSTYSGPPGELQLEVHGDLRERIVRQLAEPPVFAGAYVILEQNCPASDYCKMQFLVNRRTGQAVPTFFKADAMGTGDHRRVVGEWVRTAVVDSRLLITQKVLPGKNGQPARHFNKYYVLRDGDLELIMQLELPNPFGL